MRIGDYIGEATEYDKKEMLEERRPKNRRAVNYRSEVEPLFRSTPTSFFVTLYNLNYNVPIEKVLIDPEKVSFESEKVLFARIRTATCG